jgi:hypothetical protein
MRHKRITKNYTIQPFQIGPDQSEIDLLMINFRAQNLASAQAHASPWPAPRSFRSAIENGPSSWQSWGRSQGGTCLHRHDADVGSQPADSH